MSATDDLLSDAETRVVDLLARPGDWLSGAERIGIWREVRGEATDRLSPPAVDVVRRVTTAPGELTKEWATEAMADLGEERYTELVGVTATCVTVDHFRSARGLDRQPLPEPIEGEPLQVRPADVGDIGAWVSQSVDKSLANVSRALSLVPATNEMWRVLVGAFYSRGAEFLELTWDRALSRPQVELVAARTTSLNECFY